jgi:hypothetical protein
LRAHASNLLAANADRSQGAIVQKTPREQASLKRKWIDFLRQWLTATQNFTQAGSAALDLDKSRDEALNIIEDEMAHA